MTRPAGTLLEVWYVGGATLRPALRTACCACASDWPVTEGIVTITGPREEIIVTRPPRPICDPAAGSMEMTCPAATVLLLRAGPFTTCNPALASSARAVLTLWPVTGGTVTYRPAASHQASTPTSTTAGRMRTRLVNSHRCSHGSR